MKKSLLYSLLIVLATLIIDQITKRYALNLDTLHYNPGVIFGLLNDVPATFRIIGLSTFFGFIFFIYLVLIYLLPETVNKLKYSISLLIGGILGNVIDKTFLGKTIDFIPIKGSNIELYFNLADIFQWIGAILIIYKLFKKEKVIWFPDNLRGSYLVNPKEQLSFALKMSAIAISTSLILGLFSFTFLKVTLQSFNIDVASATLSTFAIVYLMLTIIFFILVFICGVIISHKTAGPLYAFEMYVEDLLNGEDKKLNLRDGDNYKHFEKVANRLYKHLKK